MMLRDNLLEWCQNEFDRAEKGPCGSNCSNAGSCEHDCGRCLEQLYDISQSDGRCDFDCPNLALKDVLCYAKERAFRITSLLRELDLSKYPRYHIFSIGCGGAPDLMAFEEMREGKQIYYEGYDYNPLWTDMHSVIERYAAGTDYMQTKLLRRDIFDVFSEGGPLDQKYNVLIMQYLISHLYGIGKRDKTEELFDLIIKNILPRRLADSPFLIIISDFDDSDSGRKKWFRLLDKLEEAGYHGTAYARSYIFKGDLGRERWSYHKNAPCFGNISYRFSPNRSLTYGAQLVIELEQVDPQITVDSDSLEKEIYLKENLLEWCQKEYDRAEKGSCGSNCSNAGSCEHDCGRCLKQVYAVSESDGFRDYDCPNLVLKDVLCYANARAFRIASLLRELDLSKYPGYHIFSIGCGGAPDLMAFEEMREGKQIYYEGYDYNPLWTDMHSVIERYAAGTDYMQTKLLRRDIFDVFSEEEPLNQEYNVLIMQNLISHLHGIGKGEKTEELFDHIIKYILPRRLTDSPFLIILSDFDDGYTGRNKWFKLLDSLEYAGYYGTAYAWSGYRKGDLGWERWTGHKDAPCFGNIIYKYLPNASASVGAKLVIELRSMPAGKQISSPIINKSVRGESKRLINTLTSYCEEQFKNYGKCLHCTHPSGRCSGSCRTCSEQINYHKDGRTKYDCQKYIYYYVCRYSWKYCSEIMYALEQFDISNYPAYNILSVGCGGAPDLMAFEEIMPAGDTKELFYTGYDINPYWTPVHNAIGHYTNEKEHFASEFKIQDIFETIKEEKLPERHYNVLVFEYFLSHFMEQYRKEVYGKLFDGLVLNILADRLDDSPFLFLINDIYHYKVTDFFNVFLEKLQEAGYRGRYKRMHFGNRKKDFNDGSIQYPSCKNKLDIPFTIDNPFDRAVDCTSAQLIVEVEKK